MSLQKSHFYLSGRFRLWDIFGHGYDCYMYGNTVLLDAAEGRTLVRVRSACEAEAEIEGWIRELTTQGVKALIFPNEELLKAWRTRLAALA